MKNLIILILLTSFNSFAQDLVKANGEKISLKGSPTLVVNIATRCGYTPQLEGLEALYKKYQGKGLKVVGVPSNDFGSQTPESDKDVKKFCKLNYGATYTIAKKIVVKGGKKHPFFKSLISQDGEGEISWNFEKFLIDKNGKLIKRFRSSVAPNSKEIAQAVEKLL